MNLRRSIGASIVITSACLSIIGVIRVVHAQNATPNITDVTVASTTATSTTVTWTTDEKTDSLVDFSLDTNYCSIRNSGDTATDHSVVIPNLDPGTTYYFRIRATDDNGNQGVSGNFTFTTSGTAATVQPKSAVQAAISAIQQVTTQQGLQQVAAALNSQASNVLGPPKILGNPQVDIGTDQATFTWNTDNSADGSVYIASEGEYDPTSGNPYPTKVDDTNPNSTSHTVTVQGLTPSTMYHYKVSSAGSVGGAGESNDLTFMTKSILPSIINPHVVTVGEHQASISWGTPFPTAGTVTYTDTASRQSLSVGDPSYLVTHIVNLTNLVFQTRYSFVVSAQDQNGNNVSSTALYFVTTKNIYPPVISQVNNNSTLYPGQDATVQTVVSWQTNEPASCFLSYVPGVVKNAADTVSSTPENAMLTNHVYVVTNFIPATVYTYWITCTDVDSNSTSSDNFVLLTPEQQKSIVDIILENFQGTFGWLNGIGGGAKK